MNSWSDVVIGVPTYRRPALLRALLESLAPEAGPHPVTVVVADNDGDPAIAALVAELADELRLDLHYRAATERGISQVRNQLIRTATELVPTWRWLVMYDDDGTLTPGCLERLLSQGEQIGADIVGGRVLHGVGEHDRAIARAYMAASLRPRANGLVDMINGAQNTALGRRVVDLVGDPWYPDDHGLSGGEDYAFFARAKALGARFGWVDDAAVNEPIPAARLTDRAVLHRAFVENAANALTDCQLHGRGAAVQHLLGDLRWPFVHLVSGLRHHDHGVMADSMVGIVGLAGRATGLAGGRFEPYRECSIVTARPSSAPSTAGPLAH